MLKNIVIILLFIFANTTKTSDQERLDNLVAQIKSCTLDPKIPPANPAPTPVVITWSTYLAGSHPKK